MSLVEMTEVGKRFGSHWVLRDLSLRLERGEDVYPVAVFAAVVAVATFRRDFSG